MHSKIILFVLYMSIVQIKLGAQDSHYWTPKYGTESTLLGGAVVGSHLDISSTFYNPGALGISENPAFLMTGWVYNLTSIKLESATGDNNDVGNLSLSPAPDYFTGLFPSSSESNQFSYSMLTRYEFHERFNSRDTFRKDVLNSPGEETYFGERYLDQDMKENWFGFTWSKALADNIGLGVTHYLAYRSQKHRSFTQSQAFTDLNNAALSLETVHYDYYNYRFLWKFGLAVDLSPLKLGIALTTPSVNLFGKGTTYKSRTITQQHIEGHEGMDYVAYNEQKELSSYFYSPLSIAFGGSFQVNNTTVHVSAEWFDKTGEFHVLPTEPFENQTTEAMSENLVVQDLKSVMNAGFGVQQWFSERFELYGSIVTDFSAMNRDSRGNVSITPWNIYHFMAGALFRLWRSEITAGLGYSFGRQDMMQSIDFTTAHEDNYLFGERHLEMGYYRNLTLLVGFSIFPTELFQKTIQGVPFIHKDKTE